MMQCTEAGLQELSSTATAPISARLPISGQRPLWYPKKSPANESEGPYVELVTPDDESYVEVQLVNHRSRVHIDIESDDIEAEAVRLEALGATRVGKIRSWVVMEAPTGQRFCIVRPVSKRFAETATEWQQNDTE